MWTTTTTYIRDSYRQLVLELMVAAVAVWWSGRPARVACTFINSSVLCGVLKTRKLQRNPTRTTISQISHPTTCDIAGTHRAWIPGNRPRFGCTSPEKSPRVVSASMSNESTWPLKTDSYPEKRCGNSLEG